MPDNIPYDPSPNKCYYRDASPTDYPAGFIARDRWISWKYDHAGQKVPRRTHSDPSNPSAGANYKDARNWTSFDVAREWVDKGYGLGFVLTADDPFVLIDFDDVRDPETGEWHPEAWDFLMEAGSYADVSVSGTGGHVLGRGDLVDGSVTVRLDDHPDFPEAKVEIYTGDRFVAMSGDHIDGTPIELRDVQPTIDALAGMVDRSDSVTIDVDPSDFDRGDRLAEGLANDDRLQALYDWAALNGDPATVGFPGDRSGAECALAAKLAYWFEWDTDAVRAAMNRVSPPKWADEGDGYRDSVLAAVDIDDVYEATEGESRPSRELVFGAWSDLVLEGPMSTKEVAESVEYSARQTRKALHWLEDHGVVEYRRDGRQGTWSATGQVDYDVLDSELNSIETRDEYLRNRNLEMFGRDNRQ